MALFLLNTRLFARVTEKSIVYYIYRKNELINYFTSQLIFFFIQILLPSIFNFYKNFSNLVLSM